MKIGAVADLHGNLPLFQGELDVLVIAGDIAPDIRMGPLFHVGDIARLGQTEWLETKYYEWEQRIPAKHIVATPGNHDWFARLPEKCRTKLLIDEGISIDGVTFYGTPWVAPCGGWNFELSRGQRAARFGDIPFGVDVLIAHSPAHRVLDRNKLGDDCGCPELRAAIYSKQPRHCFFGHIHEGGREKVDAVLGKTQMHHVTLQPDAKRIRTFHVDKRASVVLT